MKKPFEYEMCKTCTCVCWNWAENQRGFCSGLVKSPNPPRDVIRFCLLEKDSGDYVDLSLAESFDICAVISNAAIERLKILGAKKCLK